MQTKMIKLSTMLLIAALFVLAAIPAVAAPAQQDQDIVDIAVADGRFTTLVTALQEAGLVDTLKGEGPFTVFAPTDDAFNALPDGMLESLLADKEQLTDVLLHHVVPGKVMAADVVALSSADTVLGQPVSISVADGNVMVDGANVIITDIEGTNGVIHVIDAVIVPTAEEMATPAQLPATGGETSSGSNLALILVAISFLLLVTGGALRLRSNTN
jgi:transforming growth factor-beta-induced protein